MSKTLSSTPTGAANTAIGAKLFLLIGLSLGYFMVLLDTTIVNVALPAINHDLGGGLVGQQWILNSYTLVFASLLLTAGAISDQFGAKRIFLIGLIVFLVASALSAVAPSLGTLIALRAILGIGAAAMVPTVLALIVHEFTDPAARAKALSIWGAVSGLAMVVGPILGGVLVDTLGWRSIFLINVPIALVCIILTAVMASETPRRAQKRLDLPGQFSAILMIAALTFALVEGGTLGWTSPFILGTIALAFISAIVFLLVESRGSTPMLPLQLFSHRVVSTGLLVGLTINFALNGLLFMLSLFFQQVRGYSALIDGLAFVPLALPISIIALLVGRLVPRLGAKTLMLVGLSLITISMLLQTLTNLHTSYLLTLFAMLLMGCGIPPVLIPLTSVVISAAPKEQAGIASGALNSSRQLGGVLGVAICGLLLSTGGSFINGMHISFIVTAVLLLGSILLVLLTIARQQ
jgi:DHA2 family methylenomycin A resistance protein-like MFS transporter